jgi:hypothetical protein
MRDPDRRKPENVTARQRFAFVSRSALRFHAARAPRQPYT